MQQAAAAEGGSGTTKEGSSGTTELGSGTAKRSKAVTKKQQGSGGDAMEDLFGSDDEDEEGDVAAAAEGGPDPASLLSDYTMPSRTLNNAAVLLYRCEWCGRFA